MRFFTKIGTLEQKCPRCGGASAVEAYSFAKPVRYALAGIMLCFLAASAFSSSEALLANLPMGIGYVVFMAFMAFALWGGERVRCSSCGQFLRKEIGDGWR
jgi:hypothetical protein